MVLTAHLRELRKRLIVSVIATAIGFAICYNFSVELYDILTQPLRPSLPAGQDFLVFTGVTEPFFIYMKIGFVGGVILASPVILFQVWGFVAPGLYKEEKLWFIAIVISSVILFAAGSLFAYFVVFPFGFKYLLSYASESLKPILSMELYFSFATKFLLAFGAVFQLPLAILVLARMGVVTAGKLLSWWRYALVVILIVAAVLTPTPDVFNQFLMAGPLVVLYGLGIIVAKLFGKKKAAPSEDGDEAEEEYGDEGEEE
ncbi:MAG: twin-arginine translocase subunit TatC [Deltaproteobacteria bacterium]|nr:twin-arginine translocase subunit TatC [Deltaproteobacteria bacterium]